MSEVTARRPRTPLTSVLVIVLLIVVPLGVLAQRGGRGNSGGGAPAAAPAGQAAPAAGAAAAQAPGPAGQGRGGAPVGAAAGARGGAPVDLTGYWVSLVTEDWIERMSPDSPPSGVPRGGRGGGGGNRGGGGGAQAPAAPSSEQCRVYAAGGSMRVPGRLHVTWADDNTLKVDMDAGTQTRLFHFNAAAPAGTPKSLQGYSVATWEVGGGGRGGGGFGGGGNRGGGGAPPAPRWGNLKVVTTNLSGGYLLSSRSAYSENAVLTESFARHSDFGAEYITVIASLEDGGGNPRVVSSTFKKEADGSKFAPAGCEVVR